MIRKINTYTMKKKWVEWNWDEKSRWIENYWLGKKK